jgi:hypothetical protein
VKSFRLVVLLYVTAMSAALAACPVTLPSASPVTVPGQPSNQYFGWYGTEALAVLLPADGHWKGMGQKHRFRDKFWVWRRGYDVEAEGRPALTFVGAKLGESNRERLQPEPATNAYGTGWSSMLTLMEFPSPGCWQVTGTYERLGVEQTLTFTVNVSD